MGVLERDGLVSRVQGKGTFVHENARQRLASGLDILALVIPEVFSGYYPSLQHSFEESSSQSQNQMLVCNGLYHPLDVSNFQGVPLLNFLFLVGCSISDPGNLFSVDFDAAS